MVRFNALKPYTTRVVACGRDATIVKTTAPAVSILKSPKLFCAHRPHGHFVPRVAYVAIFALATKSSGGVTAWSRWCLVQRLTGAAQTRSTAAALPEVFDGEHSADDKA
jgi:hypothetical protein